MERLEFNKLLDNYLTTGEMLSTDYEFLDDYQVYTIQELKRAFARLKKHDNTWKNTKEWK